VDLTRFDFHAYRFLHSENVLAMSAEEVGQYILLLCEAWCSGKDATLPITDSYLRRAARTESVSKKVMAQFHIVTTQWGDRLQNDTLSEEWNRACARSGKKRGAAEEKWGSNPDNRAKRSERLTAAREKGKHTDIEWVFLRTACENKCVRCRMTGSLVKDHIKPIYQGGSDGIDNIQPLCVSCNSGKGPDNTDHRPENWRDLVSALAGNSQASNASSAGIERLPKPNQAVSDQAVPDQTEQESEYMSLKTRINEIAGRKIVDGRNTADLEFIARKFGKENVIDDFLNWMQDPVHADLNYPVSAYIAAADSRLQAGAERGIIKSDERINEIVAFVYTVSQQAPRSADVVALLAENEQSEIQDAFKEYADGLDDFGLKNSARAFFKDGAGTGIILARRQKKAAAEQQKLDIAKSTEVGVAQRRATQEELAKRIQDEKDLADKLGDSPF
jgi:uncharacterized protein YdaU (DUF1376 family)